MSTPVALPLAPLTTLADGTIKQVNPFTGTEVWTVPGRGNRPISHPTPEEHPVTAHDRDYECAFCSARYRETPPEKARVVVDNNKWTTLYRLKESQLDDSVAEFRRVPNLFEILGYEYWRANHGFAMDPETSTHMNDYLSEPAGRQHVLNIIATRLRSAGTPESEIKDTPETELLKRAPAYFAGGHDVIVARRHFTDDATSSRQLASSGTLTPEEHYQFINFTADAMRDLYSRNRYARYVAVFQNWLKPAGASFDHLHKQLVAIDERGAQAELEIARLRSNPNMYNEWAVDYAGYHNLVIAENTHAIAFAGFGHRYPTIEFYSRSATCEPWKLSEEEMRDMSDLIHACHAATGSDVPCNEEWHHKPIDLDIPMPWRVMIKWRASNLAGFEGSTKVYLNTISPENIRQRMSKRLSQLREEGRLAESVRIAGELTYRRNSLKYNPALR
ncbi:DUF4921 family protein [Corynebacterium kroppenstedtii]|uniref:DUF4921 family protein n=1 Tax=Corynebacterium kroppenstedtii TaxID=161879 RepID=UPI003872F403